MATLTRKKIRTLLALFLLTTLMLTASRAAVNAEDPKNLPRNNRVSYRIASVSWEQTAEDYILRIKGNSAPTYTMYELFEPLRVVVDIANATLDTAIPLPVGLPQSPVSVVNGKVITDKEPSITRIELFLRSDHNFTVDKAENDILVKFPKERLQNAENENSSSPSIPNSNNIPQSNETTASIGNHSENTNFDSEKANGLFATKLINIEVTKSPAETKVYLKADGSIKSFKKTLLEKNPATNRPDRMYIDLNNIRLQGAAETISVGTALSKVRTVKRQDGIRVIFDSGLDKIFDYSVSKEQDGLLITIKEPSSANNIITDLLKTTNGNPAGDKHQSDSVNSKANSLSSNVSDSEPAKPSLPTSTDVLDEKGLDNNKDQGISKAFKAPTPTDLAFAGYNKQRITVDFYKIDLHNVFRLFGDISNLNIVVDEAVNGSLTLALNDVPWDFALDIILNLKDLQKEERFNTIVISPKSKSFTWPERALDNVEFKSDIKVQQQDLDQGGLKISKRVEVPEPIVEAKKLIHQANMLERKGDYASALPIYEDAFNKWNDNENLARKIAAICLVNLEQNAMAVHYAKAVLKLSPGDQIASLQAAIGLARMQKNSEAKQFFDLSIAGDKPPSEALISYSSFCEDQQDMDCALTHLQRHEELYGDNLVTMVSKARIYDKLGNQEKAAKEYQTILLSGFELPPDLARYIKGRAAVLVH